MTSSVLLLGLLGERPQHEYELMQSLENRFGGRYSPSPGTVYPRLRRMVDDGLVVVRQACGRAVYELTDAGRAELDRRRAELDRVEASAGGSLRGLTDVIRDDVRAAVAALHRELRAGGEAQPGS
ncbi:PadR family transcriptional regulator [Micromonospora sp. CPCC 206061]|uniref:PadR family transcriptional regulator n=1 Tax=Micromonospora sp. CPCC 206061 TaxID=3122410 RepID=UPI002FF29E23